MSSPSAPANKLHGYYRSDRVDLGTARAANEVKIHLVDDVVIGPR